MTTPDPTGNPAIRNQNYERINYDTAINGRLIVNGLGGNDYFASDDNARDHDARRRRRQRHLPDRPDLRPLSATPLTFRRAATRASPAERPSTALTRDTSCGSLNPQDIFGTVATTRGWLSAGASQPLVAVGDVGDDVFTVYSNQAPLRLEGGDGNDLFIVRGFALAQTKTNGGNPTTAPTATRARANTDCEIVWINAQDQIAMPKLTSGLLDRGRERHPHRRRARTRSSTT